MPRIFVTASIGCIVFSIIAFFELSRIVHPLAAAVLIVAIFPTITVLMVDAWKHNHPIDRGF